MTPQVVLDICARLGAHFDDPSGDATAAGLAARACVIGRELLPLATNDEIGHAAEAAVAHIQGLGPLQPLLADPEVNEIIVNNGGDVWVDRGGTLARAGRLAPGVTSHLVQRMLGPLGRRVDRLSPIVDAHLPDGGRLCAVVPPIAVDGPCVAIRRFGATRRPLEAFADAPTAQLLRELVASRCNIIVSGATSSGKTSLLNALVSAAATSERIITLEDAAELQLDAAHVLRLETRPATAEGVAAVSMTDLVRTALRLRPDRLVIGEIRGPEIIDMLQAMNTGHDGSFATLHANSAADAVRRIEALVVQFSPGWPMRALHDHVRSSVDVVIHVARRPDGQRRVDEVVELGLPGSSDSRALVIDTMVTNHPQRTRV